MREADYYPPGAYYDPNAPWNEVEVPEREFNVTVSQTLSKSVEVYTNDYICDIDEENGHVYPITEDTNWIEAYEDQHYTIPELLRYLQIYIEENLKDEELSSGKRMQLQGLLDSCKGWVVDDYVVYNE